MTKTELHSALWFELDDLRSFGHRSRIMQMGYSKEDCDGKSIIAILNSWFGINPCILHVSPESHIGEQLALVKTGDRIAIDVPARTISLIVDDEELARRRAQWIKPEPNFQRGYG